MVLVRRSQRICCTGIRFTPRSSLTFTLLFVLCCVLYIFATTNDSPDIPLGNNLDSPEITERKVHANIRVALHTVLSKLTALSTNITSTRDLDAGSQRLQYFLDCSVKQQALPKHTHLLKPLNSQVTLPQSRSICVEPLGMSDITQEWTIPELCGYLLTKRILLVGSRTTYRLHDKLIDILPSGTRGSESSCPGAAMCTWHEICASSDSRTPAPARMTPVTRHRAPPHNLNDSAILRFALATTLCPHPIAAPVPYVSPLTGVREYDAYDWLVKARRADLLVLAKTPVPAPAWAYGNTSEASFSVRMPVPGSSAWSWAFPLLEVGRHDGVIGAAWKATAVKWLPELMETLLFLSKNVVSAKGKLVVWLGSSFLEEGCVWAGENVKGETDELRFNRLLRSVHMNDRCVFQNAQVYMQDALLKKILPHFNYIYIPKANPAPFQMKFQISSSESSPRTPSEHETSEMQPDRVFLNGLVTILRWQKESSRDPAYNH